MRGPKAFMNTVCRSLWVCNRRSDRPESGGTGAGGARAGFRGEAVTRRLFSATGYAAAAKAVEATVYEDKKNLLFYIDSNGRTRPVHTRRLEASRHSPAREYGARDGSLPPKSTNPSMCVSSRKKSWSTIRGSG